jgi:hypothetical protein
MQKKALWGTLCAAFFFAAPFLLAGQTPEEKPLSWTREINWEKNLLTLTIEAPLAESGPNLAAAALAAERRMDSSLPQIFSQALSAVLIDSRRSFEESLEDKDFPAQELIALSQRAQKSIPLYSRDMRRLTLSYAYSLHDILAPYYVRHKRPRDIPRHISWLPTREYTGIVIYAKGELPVHGENRDALLLPCLFPEIFDEDTNPLLLTDMGDPAWLLTWGSAAYSTSFDEAPWRERIGRTPLRLIAAGLYGKYPTDIKLNAEDAALILANAVNRRLLAEGRILIIFGEE